MFQTWAMSPLIVTLVVFLAVPCQSKSFRTQLEGLGEAEKCLKCHLNEKLSFQECLSKPEGPDKYEICQPARPECMSQLWNWKGGNKLVFASECQEIEACFQESKNEPKSNNCDDPPIHVATKCRYCCNEQNVTVEHFCPPPELPDAWELCSCWGDPHCRSFTGRRFTVGGECFYALSKTHHGTRRISVEVDYTEHGSQFHIKTLRIEVADKNRPEVILTVGPNDGINPCIIELNGVEIVPIFPDTIELEGVFLLNMNADHVVEISMKRRDNDREYNFVVLWLPHRIVQVMLKRDFHKQLEIEGICGDPDDNPDDFPDNAQKFADQFQRCY
ncbi:uncharacterized protein LOC100375590 [Saccoglossus kowalevskii]|uniref:Uncharacterized protein LOC100375590 n=1 Tax=Saccoglossus kowalevskii TaxID=10224 RepID=A0ABM0GVM2_SACKO|nr:PREDICTED: uncharacterized protein LOC100375590 [Saccoglossus kowalevskii]